MNASKAVLLICAAASAAACTPRFNTAADTLDVRRRHPISVDQTVVDYAIHPSPTDFDLTVGDAATVDAIARSFRERGVGAITVTAPQGSENARAANRLAADVRDRLYAAGLPWSVIRGASYRADVNATDAPLFVSFTTYSATTAPCGAWSRDESLSFSNLNPANFGCADAQNLAAMVVDPSDLVGPGEVDPGDLQRREAVLEGYRAGEITSTTRDRQTIASTNDVFGGE